MTNQSPASPDERSPDELSPDELSPEDEDLIARFEQAYNGIDRALKEKLGVTEYTPLRTLLEEYHRRHPHWNDKEDLIEYSRLRNVVVHNRVYPYRYYAIPTLATVRRIETIYESLTRPRTALPTWQKTVRCIETDDLLSEVLGLIDRLKYSRFPVYENSRFRGLLTENGITRWIARHCASRETIIEMEDHAVREVLRSEEARRNWEFVTAAATVEAVRYRFAANPRLEAALITQHGRPEEKLLGIVTRGDVVSAGGPNDAASRVS